MQRRGFEVGSEEAGGRLDRLVARRLDVSRSAAQRMISGGDLLVDGTKVAPSFRPRGGERIEALLQHAGPQPEEIPVPVVFEDDAVIVVDKPAGLVVHPGAGNPSGTLVNALLARGIRGGEDAARPGIVHRLDRDTSGLMVVAKDEDAYLGLVAELAARRVRRQYRALVVGTGLPETGTVDSPVGRDPDRPVLMAVGVGKEAVTHFERMDEGSGYSMLRVGLETGRTHQIRVHMSAIGYPVYADPLYGAAVPGRRLWLHAEGLAFEHPLSGRSLAFESPVPQELREAAVALDASFGLW